MVHDELDLPSGRVKVKAGGGNAGNNGLKSIDSHLHTNEYLRVRVGHRQAARPPARRRLRAEAARARPSGPVLAVAIEEAADAVEAIVTDGVEPPP